MKFHSNYYYFWGNCYYLFNFVSVLNRQFTFIFIFLWHNWSWIPVAEKHSTITLLHYFNKIYFFNVHLDKLLWQIDSQRPHSHADSSYLNRTVCADMLIKNKACCICDSRAFTLNTVFPHLILETLIYSIVCKHHLRPLWTQSPTWSSLHVYNYIRGNLLMYSEVCLF